MLQIKDSIMTHYHGGKKRISSDISKEIIRQIKLNNFKPEKYIEPFCGMLSVYDKVSSLFEHENYTIKYIMTDRNPYIITLWKSLQRGHILPDIKITKEEYLRLKGLKRKHTNSIFYGFAHSYMGIFFSTYLDNKNIKIQSDCAMSIGQKLKRHKVSLSSKEFQSHTEIRNSIIYCDPPYRNTQCMYYVKDEKDSSFDYDKFIKWVKEMGKYNNMIFISEYTKPFEECKLIWRNKNEKLFLYYEN